jgi:hypothetical protein
MEESMSKYRRWATLASVGALASACQLGLEARACGVSGSSDGDTCLEGWSCCADDVCRRDCSDDTGEQPPAMEGWSEPGTSSVGQPNPAPPYGEGPPPAPVRADVGPDGGELVLDAASAQIPPGALAAATPLELSATELPLELPRARRQTSWVYSLSAAETSFAQPVTIDVPVDASSSYHMMVLELGDAGWQPVAGARFNPDPGLDPMSTSLPGTVSWTTQHGGTFVVTVVGIQHSIELVLGGAPYLYACDTALASSVSGIDDNVGVGPFLSTQNISANSPECPWPTSVPALWLGVMFRNFLPSDGLPLGTWDLADPASILPLRVQFVASVEGALPFGQEQSYDSTTPVEGAEGPIPNVVYQGFYQSPLASGSISVWRLPTVENTGYSSSADYVDNPVRLYRIELSNVTLGATDEAEPNPDAPFPPTVSISSATLTFCL